MNELVTRQQNETGLAIGTETKELIQSSIADSTLRRYQKLSEQIEARLGGQMLTDGLLATYITELHVEGKSPATIAQAVAAVKWTASKSRIDVVGEITQRTLAGIRREGKDRGRGQVEGLIWQDVERIAAFAEADKTIAGLRDSAMIRLMSNCLLRVSEVVAVDVEDVNKTTLTVWQSKTDQEGHGESLYVCKSTRQVIKQYRQKAGIERGVLFRQIRRGDHVQSDRLTDFSARRIIQKRSRNAGVEGFISGHSLRVGSAVSLARAGASVVDMQVAGRWKSSQMPAHYAKAELAERGAIARFKDGKKVR